MMIPRTRDSNSGLFAAVFASYPSNEGCGS
jgi:hypothetical protein